MGYFRHHAILVTSWSNEHLERARDKANAIGLVTTPITPGVVNSEATFVCVPDGSKEGWSESEAFDGYREEFVNWLSELVKAEELFCAWAEVQYGDDYGDDRLLRSSAKDRESV